LSGKSLKKTKRQSKYHPNEIATTVTIHSKKYKPDLLGLIFLSSHLLKNHIGNASKASGSNQIVSELIVAGIIS